MDSSQLRTDYQLHAARAERMRIALMEQVLRLIRDNQISLGVPLESRVKTLESLLEKVERRSLNLERLTDLTDFVGLRIILLFKRDLESVQRLIGNAFRVVSMEDVATRLGAAQFGYQSLHFIVQLPPKWLAVPTLADLGDIKAEFQVRTLAQHIWAAASHELQYKQEENVPPPIRRSIHRVSALLETVDLEFDRVLLERQSYVANADPSTSSELLNVDLLAKILDDHFPPQNKGEVEPYAEVLQELTTFDIKTATDLQRLILKHKDAVLAEEARLVTDHRDRQNFTGTTKERNDAGLFFVHCGFARELLRQEFGKKYSDYSMQKNLSGFKSKTGRRA